MDTSRWTLAEVLRSRGYETAGFTSNLHYGEAGWGVGKGFEVYEDTGASLRHNLRATLAGNVFLQPLYSLVRHDDLDRRPGSTLNHEVVRWFGHRSGNPFRQLFRRAQSLLRARTVRQTFWSSFEGSSRQGEAHHGSARFVKLYV